MNKSKKNSFNELNKNLKKEIFLFIKPNQIIKNLMTINKLFYSTVKELKWFQMICDNINIEFYHEPSLDFSDMKEIFKILTNIVETEFYAIAICAYFSLRIFNHQKEKFISYNRHLSNKEQNIFYLSEILTFSTTIQEHNLHSNELGLNKKGMYYITEALKKNTSIQYLNLSKNNLGKDRVCMFYLKKALEINTSIKNLDLSSNELGNDDVIIFYLKEALEINKSIIQLNLCNNDLSTNENNMAYLKEAFQINQSILYLNLGYNNFFENEISMFYLKKAFKKNNSIKNLFLQEIN